MNDAEQQHNLKGVQVSTHCWSGVQVQALRVEVLPGKAWHQLSSDTPTLSIVVNESGGCCEARSSLDEPEIESRRPRRRRMGHTSLIPARTSVWGYSEDIDCVDEVRLMLDPGQVQEVVGGTFPIGRLGEPSLMFFDEPLQILARLIANNAPELEGYPLLGDSLVAAMIARLASLQTANYVWHRRLGLSASQAKAVTEYILDNLSRQIRLSELSTLVELSPSQLGRAFKVSFGKAPHRWHLEARIRRAMELMEDPRASLADIALQTGFSEQSHFTRGFRSVQGVTPNHWRRAHLH